jgi:hypothetical protein
MEDRFILCSLWQAMLTDKDNTTLAHVTEVGVLNFQLPELGGLVWSI